MANGLFTTPQDVLKERRAALNKTIQGLSAKQGDSRAQQAFKGLSQIGLSLAGMQQRKEQKEQLGALGGILDGFQTGQDAATNKLRDEAIANSGLGRDVQAAARTQDILKRSGGSQEGMARAGQAMIAAGNFEGGIKALEVAKAMAPEAEKAPEGKLYQIVDSQGNITGRTFVKQGESPELPEGSRLQKIGTSKDGPLVTVEGDKVLSADDQIKIASETKRAEKLAEFRAKGIATKEAEDIIIGSEASVQIPSIIRSLELLKEVETGGIEGASLRIKQVLGMEAANEAELANALEKGVISQLREVFGAQFTAKEGEWLRDIEPNLRKSTVGNKRLLERSLEFVRAAVDNGIQASIDAGDVRAKRQMEKMLGYKITPSSEPETPKPNIPAGTVDNGDGTFTMEDGTVIRAKK